jgi:hypothetical protein
MIDAHIKIQAEHRKRNAYLYIRQSTPRQDSSIRRAHSASMGSGNRHCGWAGQKNRSL